MTTTERTKSTNTPTLEARQMDANMVDQICNQVLPKLRKVKDAKNFERRDAFKNTILLLLNGSHTVDALDEVQRNALLFALPEIMDELKRLDHDRLYSYDLKKLLEKLEKQSTTREGRVQSVRDNCKKL